MSLSPPLFLLDCPCGCQARHLVDRGDLEKPWRCPETGSQTLVEGDHLFTDRDWQTWREPNVLLDAVSKHYTPRKRRLVLCGFCRLIWDKLSDNLRSIVRGAEAIAESGESTADIRVAWDQLSPAVWESEGAPTVSRAMAQNAYLSLYSEARTAELKSAECDVIRDLIRNPYRRAFFNRAWRTETVAKLTHAVYQQRTEAGTLDNLRLAILADGLEEAGCTDAEILNHCRQPGEHWRGCWLVDLILGKQ